MVLHQRILPLWSRLGVESDASGRGDDAAAAAEARHSLRMDTR